MADAVKTPSWRPSPGPVVSNGIEGDVGERGDETVVGEMVLELERRSGVGEQEKAN